VVAARAALLVASAVASCAAGERRAEFVQAVEFPYHLYPRQSWERELVWLKAIGVRTVAFPIPRAWHETGAGEPDLTGRTCTRRDLTGLVKLLRRLDLHVWLHKPAHEEGRAWTHALERLLEPQTVSHGGPVAWVEGGWLSLDAPAPPEPVTAVSATDPAALALSRRAIGGARGSLLWRDLEDTLAPAGSLAPGAALYRKGAIGLSGEERVSTAPLRRNAALLKGWSALLGALETVKLPKPASKPPETLQMREWTSTGASALSIVNSGAQPFHGEVRVIEPASRRAMAIPRVAVDAGDALWLPLNVSIGASGLCRNCSALASAETIVYATAELLSMEYENGILSMEFSTPRDAEAVLQLARQPAGPYLAAGRLAAFDFDEKTLRARLPIPAGKGLGARVRIGLAIEAPDTSSFFVDARRLVTGRANAISTSYSSPELAARSRLLLPEGWTAKKKEKSPIEIDYQVDVPAAELHGDWATLALEADGVTMGRARLQMFRPVSVRFADAVRARYGESGELTAQPAVVACDARAGRNLDLILRNNSLGIETYKVEASGEGLSFSPAATEVSIGGVMERTVSLRVFPEGAAPGLREAKVKISGPTQLELPLRLVLIPRGGSVVWSADLDGDGSPEWILESHRARAVFSSRDGGRWTEFTWKDSGVNVLPDAGLWAGAGDVEARASGAALEIGAGAWSRTVRLIDNRLEIEQNSALPAAAPQAGKVGGVAVKVERPTDRRVRVSLN
jgi:hypothetical protein